MWPTDFCAFYNERLTTQHPSKCLSYKLGWSQTEMVQCCRHSAVPQRKMNLNSGHTSFNCPKSSAVTSCCTQYKSKSQCINKGHKRSNIITTDTTGTSFNCPVPSISFTITLFSAQLSPSYWLPILSYWSPSMKGKDKDWRIHYQDKSI